MTSLLPRTLFPGLTDWFDHPWPFGEHNLVRIEEATEEGRYLVRAELPGFEPEKQIHVTAERGMLTISAVRESETKAKGHSEFRYGAFSRTIALPAGADAGKITAKYTNGILEVSVPVSEHKKDKSIEIAVDKD